MNQFLQKLLPQLKERAVRLVVVSKTQPLEAIQRLYAAGIRDFGENRVQELVPKYEALPKDIRWHLIGHLQRNKVKYIAHFVHLIHSIDSWELMQEVNKQALKHGRCIDVLLQFHVAQEETKFGFDWAKAEAMLAQQPWADLKGLRICGIMGMASLTADEEQVKGEFERLMGYFTVLKERYFADAPYFAIRSMGMSGDYVLAMEAGSTMLRIGTRCFEGD
jgi:pyridoxal phosphate enzyme (YggS family)